MGSLIPPELTLDCGKPWNRTTCEFLAEVSKIDDVSDKLLKLNDYVSQLNDEMKKIDAFKRELPLSMLLLNDAIARVKEEIMQCNKLNSKPVLEEFMPLKKISSDERDEKIEVSKEKEIVNKTEKMNWMSSVQLWCSDNNKMRKEEVVNRGTSDDLFRCGKNRKSVRPFGPFTKFPAIGKESGDELAGAPSLTLRTPEVKLRTPEVKNLKEEIYCNGFSTKSSSTKSGSLSATSGQSNFKAEQQQTGRKQRRCWSPELHRRFVSALQHLGGAQAATPKHIRELMQVDGLTNDEVKSHLQKYRLHTRRVAGLRRSQEECGESSNSPQGPLHLSGSSRGTSTTGGDSMEDEDDDKLESHSWKKSDD